MTARDVNQECDWCHDFSKRVCFCCRDEIAIKLEYLARNLAVAAALCKAWEAGWMASRERYWGDDFWAPGCGKGMT